MVDKITNINDTLNKRDLELILEVNKKSIEIETLIADQNEETIKSLTDIRNTQIEVSKTAIIIEKTLSDKNKEIISTLENIEKTQSDYDEKLNKLTEQTEQISREIFKVQILFITGLLSLIVQIISIFIKH